MKALFKIYTIYKKSNCVEIKKNIKLIKLRKLELMVEDFRVESIYSLEECFAVYFANNVVCWRI